MHVLTKSVLGLVPSELDLHLRYAEGYSHIEPPRYTNIESTGMLLNAWASLECYRTWTLSVKSWYALNSSGSTVDSTTQ